MGGQARASARGASINMVAIAVRLGVNIFVVLPILARTLGPEVFGLATMAMTLFSFLLIFGDVGIAPALVRETNPSRALWSTSWWTTGILGLLLAAVAIVSAPWLAAFYKQPEVTVLARVLAFGMVMQVLCSVPVAWLQRNQQLGTIALIDILAVLASSIAALSLAFAGAGVWAIIVQQVVSPTCKFVFSAYFARVPLQPRYDWAEIKPIVGFSTRLTGASFVTYMNRQADNLLIGRYLGTETLGLYSRAYQLMQLPNQIISQGIGFAAYPAITRIKLDSEWLRLLYVKLVSVVAMLTIPLTVSMAIAAEPIILVLMGADWLAIAPTFSLLAIAGAIQSMNSASSNIQKALGHADRMLFWSLLRLSVFVPAFAIGVWAGSTEWLAFLYLLANVLLTYPFQREVAAMVGCPVRIVLSEWIPPLVGSAVMASMMFAVQIWAESAGLPPLLELLVLLAVAPTTFIVTLAIFFRPHLVKNFDHVRHFRSSRGT